MFSFSVVESSVTVDSHSLAIPTSGFPLSLSAPGGHCHWVPLLKGLWETKNPFATQETCEFRMNERGRKPNEITGVEVVEPSRTYHKVIGSLYSVALVGIALVLRSVSLTRFAKPQDFSSSILKKEKFLRFRVHSRVVLQNHNSFYSVFLEGYHRPRLCLLRDTSHSKIRIKLANIIAPKEFEYALSPKYETLFLSVQPIQIQSDHIEAIVLRKKYFLKNYPAFELTQKGITSTRRSKKSDFVNMRISGHPDIDTILKPFPFQKVDWIPYLTTKLVDDVASHVRLFKKARRLMKKERCSDENNKLPDLETIFFDAEATMEGNICRDLVCTIHQEENYFLQDIAELVLFLLLPPEDLGTSSFRMLTRELLVNVVFKPTFDLISDPDFINQTIIRLYKNYTIKPDIFSLTIRYSESLEELQAVRENVVKEINYLRSNDSKGEMDSSLKQQLSSLLYIRKNIDTRIHRLQSGSLESDSVGFLNVIDWKDKIGTGLNLFDLPLEVIVKNNIALSYFIDYMSSLGCQSYLFFYLNVEGWKVSAEQRLQAIALQDLNSPSNTNQDKDVVFENMRESAHSIYEEIRTQPPDPEWFEETQIAVYDKLRSDERFLESFKKTLGYVKLLAELDLLRDKVEDDEEEESEYLVYDSASLGSYNDEFNETGYQSLSITSNQSDECHSRNSSPGGKSHKRVGSGSSIRIAKKNHSRNASQGSLSSIGEYVMSSNNNNNCNNDVGKYSSTLSYNLRNNSHSSLCSSNESLQIVLSAEVLEYSIVKDSGKTYAIYTVLVKSRNFKGEEEIWHVYRRYSDFYALHEKVSGAFPTLNKIKFPSKKTFGNMEKKNLENRLTMLNHYIRELLLTENLQEFPGLLDLIRKFLDQAGYEKERMEASTNVTKVIVNPIKNSVKSVSKTVTAVPSNLLNSVDTFMDGFTRALLQNKSDNFDAKVSASIDADTTDNIPLRILLLFMDEVFDLQDRNQWLRRQIVTVLRQIIKSMFGDIVNRRIIDYFAQITSPGKIAEYLLSLKDSFWPKGVPVASRAPRDESTKMRTRFAAKSALFSSLSDDLRRVIGSETSRTGILTLFDMIQHPILNKRLVFVAFEGILKTLFDEQNFSDLFYKLHSRSSRVKNELKNSQRMQINVRR
ncbi:SNX13 [Lepeophtheirus salmonis]|uniref:SNX13 n=1 Tax=Lepeophtheirus salmonis TaxID=72036 RepID=A0A7R8CHC7_LEPSM|nr:SNX13 [Lepeophtheirus salmonis]CAF2823333.1 SNX13 [Lepeophtheirus salmonis]